MSRRSNDTIKLYGYSAFARTDSNNAYHKVEAFCKWLRYIKKYGRYTTKHISIILSHYIEPISTRTVCKWLNAKIYNDITADIKIFCFVEAWYNYISNNINTNKSLYRNKQIIIAKEQYKQNIRIVQGH